MSSKRFYFVALLLGASSIMATAQKPKKTGNLGYTHIVGKGTPADLSRHHTDNSAVVLHSNSRGSAASELTKLEQQSIHSSSVSATKQARVKSAPLSKATAPKGERNTPINFASHTAAHRQMANSPKSGGRSQAVPKIH